MGLDDKLNPAEIPLFQLIDHFNLHLKLAAGSSPSAANTAQTYANAMVVFRKFIKTAYGRKRGIKAPYPLSILSDDVLLAYYDWLAGQSFAGKATPVPVSTQGKPSNADEPEAPDFSPPPAPPVKKRRYAHATIQHYLAAVKRFLTWAVAQNYLETFDLAKSKVRLKDGQSSARKAYSHRKIDPNLAAIVLYYDELNLPNDNLEDKRKAYQARRRKNAILRNRAIVHVLFDTGLRVSELTGLTRDEIDRALKTVPMPEDTAVDVVGKGGRQRTVWITQESLLRIEAYLQTRTDPSNVLFSGKKKGVAITRQMVWKIVKDAAIATNISDFTGPHAFRHWLARQLFNDEEDPVPIEDVQALLGHASPNTTRTIYAPHSSKSRLHKALKKARKRPEDTINKEGFE